MRFRKPVSRSPDLNSAQNALRDCQIAGRDMAGADLPGQIRLHPDPEGQLTGTIASPRGRLVELEVTVTRPGAWFGLHVPVLLPDLAGIRWLGFAARSNAARAMAVRACIRSGQADGYFDVFYDRHILSQSGESDHVDLLAVDHLPELPQQAPWREFILFLPPGESFGWALQDLRLFAL